MGTEAAKYGSRRLNVDVMKAGFEKHIVTDLLGYIPASGKRNLVVYEDGKQDLFFFKISQKGEDRPNTSSLQRLPK